MKFNDGRIKSWAATIKSQSIHTQLNGLGISVKYNVIYDVDQSHESNIAAERIKSATKKVKLEVDRGEASSEQSTPKPNPKAIAFSQPKSEERKKAKVSQRGRRQR